MDIMILIHLIVSVAIVVILFKNKRLIAVVALFLHLCSLFVVNIFSTGINYDYFSLTGDKMLIFINLFFYTDVFASLILANQKGTLLKKRGIK